MIYIEPNNAQSPWENLKNKADNGWIERNHKFIYNRSHELHLNIITTEKMRFYPKKYKNVWIKSFTLQSAIRKIQSKSKVKITIVNH